MTIIKINLKEIQILRIFLFFISVLIANLLITTISTLNAAEKSEEDIVVKITESMPFLDINYNGKVVRIERIQDQDYKVSNSYARTSRACPPFCIRKIETDNVKTTGEVELLDFLKDKVEHDKGLLIDARLKDWNIKGTIPGAVNIPFTLFTGGINDADTVDLLELLGVKTDKENKKWVFDDAIELMLFCNGPWCGQSQKAIKYLVKLGYPVNKIYWYRGGMQACQ